MDTQLDGKRDNKKKIKLSMVPLAALESTARALMFGAEKYERDNWRKGLPQDEIIDSLLRHANAIADTDESNIDPESGLHHIDHVLANASFLAHAIKHNWPAKKV